MEIRNILVLVKAVNEKVFLTVNNDGVIMHTEFLVVDVEEKKIILGRSYLNQLKKCKKKLQN